MLRTIAISTAALAATLALAGQATADPPATVKPAPPTTQENAPPAPTMPPSQPGDLHPNAAVTPGVKVGMAVKDNAGVVVGTISDMKPDASGSGKMFAWVKMDEGSFSVDASSLGVADGAATLNLSKEALIAQLPKPAPKG